MTGVAIGVLECKDARRTTAQASSTDLCSARPTKRVPAPNPDNATSGSAPKLDAIKTPAPSHSNNRAPRARINRPDRISCSSAAVWPMYRPMSAMNNAEIDCRGVTIRSTDEQKNMDSTICSHGRLSSVEKSTYHRHVQQDCGIKAPCSNNSAKGVFQQHAVQLMQ